ncbi:MAG: hypothetical protein QXT63_05965, partial [Thermoplasmata archaeon]
ISSNNENRKISNEKRCVLSTCMQKVLSQSTSIEKRFSFIPRYLVKVCENPDVFVERCKSCIEFLNSMNEYERGISEIILKQLFLKGNSAVTTSYEVEQTLRAISSAIERLRNIKNKGSLHSAFSEFLFVRCVSNYDFQERLGIIVEIVLQGVEKGLDVKQIFSGIARASLRSSDLAVHTMRGCLRLLSAGIDPVKFVFSCEKIDSIFGKRAPEIMSKIATAYIANQPEKAKDIDEMLTKIKNRTEVMKFLEDFLDKQ